MGILPIAVRRNLLIFKNLLYRDFVVLKKDFTSDLINIISWPASLTITFGYVLPAFDMKESYGSFLLVGSLASTFFYLAIGLASELVNDFESLRMVDALIIVPITSYRTLLFARVATFTLYSVTLTAPLLPVGKMLLQDRLDLTYFSFGKFFVMMFASGAFYGFFALWLASWIKTGRALSNVWRRIYTPMQLLGCYWFSFAMAVKVFSWTGCITLLNPLTYMTEGIRSSVFGPAEYINFWLALFVLLVYTALFGGFAIWRLRKSLDLL